MNYQLELDNIIDKIVKGRERAENGHASNVQASEQGNEPAQTFVKPSLLLHSCCGPCSSYVLEYLSDYFDITVFYYNPCIFPLEEYTHRKNVQKELISRMNSEGRTIHFVDGDYNHDSFLDCVKGLENEPEGGERCHKCYRQRLLRTAEIAASGNYDFFTTTLTVSPYKNAAVLNELGLEISRSYGVPYLLSDFKKRNGYKRSIELSKVYNLYRQNYCGCEFSVR